MRRTKPTGLPSSPGTSGCCATGPAQPSPTISVALRHGYRYLRVRCSACRQTAFLALADLDRPADTPVWKIEGALSCQPCRKRRRRAPRAVLERLTIEQTFGADPEVPIPASHLLDELELLHFLAQQRQWVALTDIDRRRFLVLEAAALVPVLVARREIEHHDELQAVRITAVGLAAIER